MQAPDGTTIGLEELRRSVVFGRGLHGLTSQAASEVQFSCSEGTSGGSVILTCLGVRPLVVCFGEESRTAVLQTGEALELQKDQQARIEVEAAEEGNTFIFSPHSPAGAGIEDPEEGPRSKRARLEERECPSAMQAAAQAAQAAASASCATAECPPPAFTLLRVRGLPQEHSCGMLGAQLADVLGGGHVLYMLISNYMINMAWLLSAVPSILDADQVVLVHGERKNPLAVKMMTDAAQGRRWTVHAPPLRDQWGVHHSKAFLLQFDRGLRVIVMTANLIYQDCNLKTQGLWYQDFPRKAAGTSSDQAACSFEAALTDYVHALRLPLQAAKQARATIAEHDFSSARAHLIASVPGYHTGADMKKYGHMRVRELLRGETFPGDFQHAPLVAQFSSMGSVNPKWLEELQHSFAQGSYHDRQVTRPLGKPEDFRVVWPTVSAVRDSNEGWFAGCSIPGSATNVLRAAKGSTMPMLKQHWCIWDGKPTAVGRQHAMPHIKTYLRHRGQKVAYLVVTSHNLSKAAWGVLQKGETQMYIMHYELGVMLLPSLEQAYRSHEHFGFSCTSKAPQLSRAGEPQDVQFWAKGGADAHSSAASDACAVELPVPYMLPPQRYGASDEPWRVGEAFSGLDSKGCTVQGSYERNSHYGNEEQAD